MTRRLVALVVGLTVLVVAGFAIPLAIVVREIQRDDGVDAVVSTAASLAAFIDNDTPRREIAAAVERLGVENPAYEVTVFARGGAQIGAANPRDEFAELAFEGRESTLHDGGGLIDYAPNNGPFAGPSDYVIRVAAPAAAIEPDLTSFRVVLGLSVALALALAAGAGVFAARSIARPTLQLTEVAQRLEGGELDTPVPVEGPPEIRELAGALAHLSARIRGLLHAERETAADLAHRMRTPLTALHIEVEALPEASDRERLLLRVRRTERLLDEVIAELRRPADAAPAPSDLCEVVRERAAIWEEVAAERGYRLRADLNVDGSRPVGAATADLEAAVDVLIDNVVTHTPEGTSATISVADGGGFVVLGVEDDGPGLPPGAIAERGVSDSESSGLGLDIARRTVERAGGRFELAVSGSGGALVRLAFPRVEG